MPYTATIKYSVATPAGTIEATGSQTTDSIAAIDTVLGANGTNVEYDLDFKKDQAKVIVIKSVVAVTIKTNSSSAPDQTITLAAGESIVWRLGAGFANPISADIAKVFITNVASGALQFFVLHDPTA